MMHEEDLKHYIIRQQLIPFFKCAFHLIVPLDISWRISVGITFLNITKCFKTKLFLF